MMEEEKLTYDAGEAGADVGRRVEAMRGEAKGHKRRGEPGVSVVVVQRATQTNEEATDCQDFVIFVDYAPRAFAD